MHERRGDLAGAASLYRAILDEQPDAQRSRLELARILALMGDDAGARRELRRAGAVGLPDDVARVVDQFASALRSRRRAGGSLNIALAPSTNINRATSARSIDTVIGPFTPNVDSRATSGVGLNLGAQGYWRSSTGPSALLLRMSGSGDFYTQSRFNDLSILGQAGPELRRGRSRFRPALSYSAQWFGGKPYAAGVGASANWLRAVGRTAEVEIEAAVLQRRYRQNGLQNGRVFALSTNFDKALGDSLSFRASAQLARTAARDPGYSSMSGSVGGLVAKREGGKTWLVEVTGSHLHSDARLLLFPIRRSDWGVDASVGILINRWAFKGLSPLVRVHQVWNSSTVDIYRFSQTRIEFGLSQEF